MAAYDSRFPAFLQEVRVQQGAPETLGRLRTLDVPLAVVTNCPGAVGHSVLEHTGLASCFHAILTASDVPKEKPAPDMVLEAARRLGVKPARMVVVGDTEVDRGAAVGAGAPFVLFAGFEALSRLWGLPLPH
jgi:HAD superfamily hydrolase (TIGR01509 family)